MKTAGNWNPEEDQVQFIASNIGVLTWAAPVNPWVLVAVNELSSPHSEDELEAVIQGGGHVLVDSGVFWLSTSHAKANGISMNEALALAPDDIDGFDELYARYLRIIERFGDRSWGYIEIDQGGRENKIKTRARLEAEGLRPIPVYHPLNDGWDYFDHLAENYDRICLGNVVQADDATRWRIVATLWERRRKYPGLWIHQLGVTAGSMTTSWPLNSCDSSTWLWSVRWGMHRARVANQRTWPLCEGFQYRHNEEWDGQPSTRKAYRFCGYDAAFMTRNMRTMTREVEDVLGCDVRYP